MGRVSTDDCRLTYINKLTANPKHPRTRFDAGNKDTLKETEMLSILQEIKSFYQKYYTADKMTLILESTHSLSELESIAKEYFGKILKSPIPQSKLVKELMFTKAQLGLALHLESIQKNRSMDLDFILQHKRSQELNAALTYNLLF